MSWSGPRLRIIVCCPGGGRTLIHKGHSYAIQASKKGRGGGRRNFGTVGRRRRLSIAAAAWMSSWCVPSWAATSPTDQTIENSGQTLTLDAGTGSLVLYSKPVIEPTPIGTIHGGTVVTADGCGWRSHR